MDPDLVALKVAIEAASPGTPSLTCLRIADAVSVMLREAKAEAWDEGMRTGTSRAMRHMSDEPHIRCATPADNPYRD